MATRAHLSRELAWAETHVSVTDSTSCFEMGPDQVGIDVVNEWFGIHGLPRPHCDVLMHSKYGAEFDSLLGHKRSPFGVTCIPFYHLWHMM